MSWTEKDVAEHMARLGREASCSLTGEQAKALTRVAAAPRKATGQQEQNKTEASYEAWLTLRHMAKEVSWYAFKPLKFRLATLCTLTPDFMVQYPDGRIDLVDTKGTKGERYWATEDSKIKIRVAAETYKMFGWVIAWKAKNGEWREERF